MEFKHDFKFYDPSPNFPLYLRSKCLNPGKLTLSAVINFRTLNSFLQVNTLPQFMSTHTSSYKFAEISFRLWPFQKWQTGPFSGRDSPGKDKEMRPIVVNSSLTD